MIDFAICVMGDFSLDRGPVIGDFAICFLRDAVGEMTYLRRVRNRTSRAC